MPADSNGFDRSIEWYLVEGGTDRKFLLRDGLVIGRSQGDLTFPEHEILSGQHCKIGVLQLSCTIEDLKSKNGTFVNGERLQAGEPRRINPSDEIVLGTVKFKLKRIDIELPAPVPADGAHLPPPPPQADPLPGASAWPPEAPANAAVNEPVNAPAAEPSQPEIPLPEAPVPAEVVPVDAIAEESKPETPPIVMVPEALPEVPQPKLMPTVEDVSVIAQPTEASVSREVPVPREAPAPVIPIVRSAPTLVVLKGQAPETEHRIEEEAQRATFREKAKVAIVAAVALTAVGFGAVAWLFGGAQEQYRLEFTLRQEAAQKAHAQMKELFEKNECPANPFECVDHAYEMVSKDFASVWILFFADQASVGEEFRKSERQRCGTECEDAAMVTYDEALLNQLERVSPRRFFVYSSAMKDASLRLMEDTHAMHLIANLKAQLESDLNAQGLNQRLSSGPLAARWQGLQERLARIEIRGLMEGTFLLTAAEIDYQKAIKGLNPKFKYKDKTIEFRESLIAAPRSPASEK